MSCCFLSEGLLQVLGSLLRLLQQPEHYWSPEVPSAFVIFSGRNRDLWVQLDGSDQDVSVYLVLFLWFTSIQTVQAASPDPRVRSYYCTSAVVNHVCVASTCLSGPAGAWVDAVVSIHPNNMISDVASVATRNKAVAIAHVSEEECSSPHPPCVSDGAESLQADFVIYPPNWKSKEYKCGEKSQTYLRAKSSQQWWHWRHWIESVVDTCFFILHGHSCWSLIGWQGTPTKEETEPRRATSSSAGNSSPAGITL